MGLVLPHRRTQTEFVESLKVNAAGCLVPMEAVASAIRHIDSLGLPEREQFCDEIFTAQPLVLRTVLELRDHNVSMPDLDHVLYVLMVMHAAFKEGREAVSLFSEPQMAKAMKNHDLMLSLFDDAQEEEEKHINELILSSYPEPYVLTFVLDYLSKHLLNRPFSEPIESAVHAMKALLDCYVSASRGRESRRESDE